MKTPLRLVLSSAIAMSFTAHGDDSDSLEEIVVTAHPLSAEGLSQASTVLEGAELERKLGSNIGATLAREPGIHSAQFGNAVGRPVIHGLGGPRVRIMEDRIDTLDVSVTSADHAVTIEPFVANRIEVLKGPSALLYGSGAIGGVVDVHTGRIPHEIPDSSFAGGIETRFDQNTSGNATTAKLNGNVGRFAWHFDGNKKDGDDYEIPAASESVRLRILEGEDIEEEGDGILPGSAFDSRSFALGGSYIDSWGFAGAAVSTLRADYGLPGGHGHEHEGEEEEGEEEEEEGNPLLSLEQVRTDVELGFKNPFGSSSPFTGLNIRLGVNDYEHQEIEPDGEIATEFNNDAWELRGELVYESENWSGAAGLQTMRREFSALGEEAFVPPVDTDDVGIFWVAERDYGGFTLETGLRIGRVEHSPSVGEERDFTTYAASLGAVIPLQDGLRIGVNIDQSSRAPVGEELYANGAHLATNAFELGDSNLDSEQATSFSTTINYDQERWSAVATAYYTRFDDFIYEQATGEIEDDLPVFAYLQGAANFYGIDAEAEAVVSRWDTGQLSVRGMFDFVNARLREGTHRNLPRIPPMRYGLGVGVTHGSFTGSLEYTRVKQQDDTAELELITDAYNDLRVRAEYDVDIASGSLSLFVNGRNLTDQEQRSHTSFIKEFAPLPGRTLEVGLRWLF